MNRFSIFFFRLLLFFVMPVSSIAQLNPGFLKHLGKSGLQREQYTYLMQLSGTIPDDSLNYLFAKYYLQEQQDSLFTLKYALSKPLFISDTESFNRANIHFLLASGSKQALWYNSYDAKSVNGPAQSIHYAYTASLFPGKADLHLLPEALQEDFLGFRKASLKKEWVAGTLSAVVPGLGKLYAGRKASFVVTLFTHLAYAAQAYESFRILGPSNAFSIISCSVFGVFYAANIYGSCREVKIKKRETRKQFLLHATDYYNFNCAHDLYP
jgi:hypothetical protein